MSVPANGKTTEELVTERLSLSNGTETSVGNLLSVKLNTVLRESESLLHKRCQLPDSPPLLTYKYPIAILMRSSLASFVHFQD